jgi:hypothetical protein
LGASARAVQPEHDEIRAELDRPVADRGDGLAENRRALGLRPAARSRVEEPAEARPGLLDDGLGVVLRQHVVGCEDGMSLGP